MKILISLFLATVLLSGCERTTDLLQKPPEPPKQQKPDIPQPPKPPEPPQPPEPPKPPVPGPLVTKVYKLGESNFGTTGAEVDVLWVIDNSSSMGTYQAEVIANTDRFIQNFTGDSQLHWKMGLISTDIDQQPFLGFDSSNVFDWKSSNAVQTFQDAVRRLARGSDSEQVFGPIAKHFNAFPKFLRPNAYLAIIMVSDEEEQTFNTTVASFHSYLVNLKGGKSEKVLIYGVVATENSNCYAYKNVPGSRFYDFITMAKGKFFDLCANDYGPNLAAIGKDLVSQITVLNPVILLEHAVDLKTLTISHKGKILKQGFLSEGGQWIYDVATNTVRIIDTSLLDPSDPNFTLTYNVIAGP